MGMTIIEGVDVPDPNDGLVDRDTTHGGPVRVTSEQLATEMLYLEVEELQLRLYHERREALLELSRIWGSLTGGQRDSVWERLRTQVGDDPTFCSHGMFRKGAGACTEPGCA